MAPPVKAMRTIAVSAKMMATVRSVLFLFTVFSGVRLFSYLPQIRKVASDTNKASAISYSTWSMWTGANLARALHAATNLRRCSKRIVCARVRGHLLLGAGIQALAILAVHIGAAGFKRCDRRGLAFRRRQPDPRSYRSAGKMQCFSVCIPGTVTSFS
jgi:hypothetical protein